MSGVVGAPRLWHVSIVVYFVSAWLGIAAQEGKQRRNVLMLAVDDMRPDLGAYNFSLAHTPNMDSLARQGVTFKRAYIQMAYCSPSRNSFMSGRRPDTTQVWNHVNSFRELDVGPNWTSLPGYFRQNGYITLGSGKVYHLGIPHDNDYAQSWSPEWPYFSPECQPPRCPSSQKLPKPIQPACLEREPTVCVADLPANESRLEYQLEDMQIRDSCIKELNIAKNSGKNFFVACGFHKPHVPWIVPAEYWDYFPKDVDDIPLAKDPFAPVGMPDIAYHLPADVAGFPKAKFNRTQNETLSRVYRRAYYAAIAYTDYNIGMVLDTLDTLALKDSTAVLLFGDHGWQLGEHNIWAKMTNFELAVRVPMIVRAPWIAGTEGQVANALVEAVDWYPTLVELAGLPDPKLLGEKLNGTSLVPILRDPLGTSIKRAAFSQFAKESRHHPFDVNCHFDKHKTEVMGYSVRVNDWRYTAWFGVPKGQLLPNTSDIIATELYSHEGDDGDLDFPGENVNVVREPGHSTIVHELHMMVLNYIQIWPSNGSNLLSPPTLQATPELFFA